MAAHGSGGLKAARGLRNSVALQWTGEEAFLLEKERLADEILASPKGRRNPRRRPYREGASLRDLPLLRGDLRGEVVSPRVRGNDAVEDGTADDDPSAAKPFPHPPSAPSPGGRGYFRPAFAVNS